MGEIDELVQKLATKALEHNVLVSTAESCTGGFIAKVCTDLAGSSQWFDSGFIAYSNLAKQSMLGVLPDTLTMHGAVSEAVVKEMSEGALRNSQADLAVAVSGVAGPGGGTADKPVGLVWVSWALKGGDTLAQAYHFKGDRAEVRRQTVKEALKGFIKLLSK